MDAIQAVLQEKTLEQLGALEDRVNRDSQYHVTVERKLQEIRELKHKVLELRKKKEDLQQKLRHLPTDSLGAKLLRDVPTATAAETSTVCLSLEEQREVVIRAEKQEKIRQLQYQLVAYRCAGSTASIVERKGETKATRIRFETTYKGEYFDPFYLELMFVGKKIKPAWHTIPIFVPLTDLVEKYNTKQIHFATLMCIIHSFLTAFIQRREQAAEFTSKYSEYLQEEIASFYAYNFIQLVLSVPVEESSVSLVVHLHYKDLQADLPSKVRCNSPSDMAMDRTRVKRAFMTLPIAEAFQHLFLDQNIEQG